VTSNSDFKGTLLFRRWIFQRQSTSGSICSSAHDELRHTVAYHCTDVHRRSVNSPPGRSYYMI